MLNQVLPKILTTNINIRLEMYLLVAHTKELIITESILVLIKHGKELYGTEKVAVNILMYGMAVNGYLNGLMEAVGGFNGLIMKDFLVINQIKINKNNFMKTIQFKYVIFC